MVYLMSILGDVEHTSFYHYNFICTLLNDLFGIQTRGGCMCSGPYSIQYGFIKILA